MNKKYIITIICFLLVTLIVCGCGKNSGETGNINPETTVNYNTSFKNMPKMSYENVATYVFEDTVIFEYINPGLDSFVAEVVSYSLSQDKVLGQLSLGEGNFQLSVTEDGFAVIDLTKNTVDYFGKDCSKTGSIKVFENNMLCFAELSRDGKYILAQNYESELLIFNSKTQKVSTLNKGKIFEKAEYYNGKFYLLGAGAGILEPENNHYYSISDVVRTYGAVGDYAVGINGSYLACLSTKGDEHKMINIGERSG